MKEVRISQEQFGALLWAGALAPIIELLPTVTLPIAGRGAWLASLGAILVLVPFFWRVDRLNGGVLEAKQRLGTVVGSVFLIVYLAWMELLLALRLALCARRMLISGERDGSLWFFLVMLTALSLWMAWGDLHSFARAGQLFLTVLVVVGGIVFLLSISEVRPDWVLPIWKEDTIPIVASSVPVAGTILWSMIPMMCIQAETQDRKNVILWWGVGGCLVIAGMQFIILGNLGSGLAAKVQNPFFMLTKSVGIEGAFQRVESVVSAVWLLADLTLLVTLLFAIVQVMEVIIPVVSRSWVIVGALMLAVWGATTWCIRGESVEEWNQTWVLVVNLVIGFGGTTFLYIGGIIYKQIVSYRDKNKGYGK